MINKMLPYYGVIMKKRDVCTYPRYELEKGFSFEAYTPGMEGDWCRIQTKAGMAATWNEAKVVFEQKFKPYSELLTKYCVFIVNSENYAVAAAALWPGKHFGKELDNIVKQAEKSGDGPGKSTYNQTVRYVCSEGAWRLAICNKPVLELLCYQYLLSFWFSSLYWGTASELA